MCIVWRASRRRQFIRRYYGDRCITYRLRLSNSDQQEAGVHEG